MGLVTLIFGLKIDSSFGGGQGGVFAAEVLSGFAFCAF